MADGAEGLPAEAAGSRGGCASEGALEVVGERAADGAPADGRGRVRYSEAVAGEIVARVSAGESVVKVCRDRRMPHATSVYAWARAEPRFGRALAVAHQTANRAKLKAQRAAAKARWDRGRDPRGRWSTYTPELGEEICRRMIEGQTLKTIGEDPEMPCAATILNWVREIPGFEDRYVQARERMAEVMFDEARDLAMAATPTTVWAQKLKVDTIFRMVTRMRPRKYCERVLAAEAIEEIRAEMARPCVEDGLTVIIKRENEITEEDYENARLTEEGYFDRPKRRLR